MLLREMCIRDRAASVEAVRDMACTVLEHGVSLVLLSIGAFADAAFYGQVRDAADVYKRQILHTISSKSHASVFASAISAMDRTFSPRFTVSRYVISNLHHACSRISFT